MTLDTPATDRSAAKNAPAPKNHPEPETFSNPTTSRIPRHKVDRRTRRLVFGLTGVLGVAWAVVIASRYAGLLAS
jgi:hypothetical protein